MLSILKAHHLMLRFFVGPKSWADDQVYDSNTFVCLGVVKHVFKSEWILTHVKSNKNILLDNNFFLFFYIQLKDLFHF